MRSILLAGEVCGLY